MVSMLLKFLLCVTPSPSQLGNNNHHYHLSLLITVHIAFGCTDGKKEEMRVDRDQWLLAH